MNLKSAQFISISSNRSLTYWKKWEVGVGKKGGGGSCMNNYRQPFSDASLAERCLEVSQLLRQHSRSKKRELRNWNYPLGIGKITNVSTQIAVSISKQQFSAISAFLKFTMLFPSLIQKGWLLLKSTIHGEKRTFLMLHLFNYEVWNYPYPFNNGMLEIIAIV